MARKSTPRPDADEPEVEAEAALDETAADVDLDKDGDLDKDADLDTDADDSPPADRSLWSDVRIDPVEIALPSGAGFTLRAYRMSSEVTPTDIGEREDDDLFASRSRPAVDDEDDETVVILDEEFAALSAETDDEEEPDTKSRRATKKKKSDDDETADEPDGKDADAESDDADEAEEAEEAEPDDEEVPAFLSHNGKLLLFKTPEALVSFVRSGAPNDLTQLDTWPKLVERLQPADVAPLDEDSYELDLVVENLRGGHDVWDATLLIEAGEVSRDLAYALRLPAVLDMLSPGSSLDDLDEALRSTAKGGLGGFMGRRRLKKIGAQTASLGWRTIIGKISAAVDWRD
ncbi:DNA primase [Polymorphospora rubra]|uniref:DNA primase n=1 Tax=Polymorphospora rubra TaxID=338584 RepID=UPI0033E6E315